MDTTGRLIFQCNIVERVYVEEGFQPIPRVRLEDAEYGRGLQRFIGVCTDIVIVNRERRQIYLARRRSKPMTGWWWLGGGQMVNETDVEAATRSFERETKIRLSHYRLIRIATHDYFWKDRQQEPQSIGCHMEGKTFMVELTDAEISNIKLDPDEFEAEKGLTAFTREELVKEGVFPAILDFYDMVFPPEALHHVVLIKFKDGTPDSVKQDIYDRYQTLGDDCGGRDAGILSWMVKKNLDLRKGISLVEIAIFTDSDALQKFRVHPKHVEIADILQHVADWFVGDIMG